MKIHMTQDIQIAPNTFLSTKMRRRIPLCGIEFEEEFLSELVCKHMFQTQEHDSPTISTAFEIYMRENTASHRRKFQLARNYPGRSVVDSWALYDNYGIEPKLIDWSNK